MKAAIYLRVSTADQTTENQRIALEELVHHRGWNLMEIYRDHAVSGAIAADRRPALRKMLDDCRKGRINVVVAWSIDRLGRSVIDLHKTLGEIHDTACNLVIHQQSLDTTTAHGRMMFGMMAVFAEFEREQIRERVKAGLRRAKAEGKKLGAPTKPTATRAQVATLIKDTAFKLAEIAAMCDVSLSYVEKVSQEIPHSEKVLRQGRNIVQKA